MIARLADWCFGRRWKIVLAWVAVLVGVFGWSAALGGATPDGAFDIPSSDSRSGIDILEANFPAGGGGLAGSIVFRSTRDVTDPSVRAPMQRLFDEVEDYPGLSLESPYAPGEAGTAQISADGRTAFATVNLAPGVDQTEAGDLGKRINAALPQIKGTEIHVGGQIFSGLEPPTSETVGVAFAIFVLILAFGSVLAMGLPIAVAVGGVATGAGVIALLTHLVAIPDETSTIGAMIGLGVGIDYALFIVTRYREGLHAGLSPRRANRLAYDTAGRAVVFAGLTVVISLLGMLIMQLKFITGLGIGASVTVAVTMIASITLLPAMLALAGDRLEVTRRRGLIASAFIAAALLGVGLKLPAVVPGIAGALGVLTLIAGMFVPWLKQAVVHRPPKPHDQTFAYRWSHTIQRHPWWSVLGASVLLLGLAIPMLDMHLGNSDDGNFPEGSATREAYDLMAEGFGPGFNGPLLVPAVWKGSPDLPKLAGIAEELKKVPGVAGVLGPVPNNINMADPLKTDFAKTKAVLFRVIPTTSPQARATERLIVRLRGDVLPELTKGTTIQAHVTGMTAISYDFTEYLGGRMLTFIGVVLALSFVLLMAVFRSLLVPLKAVIMNLLSIGAAYGIIVAVFQWGWGASVFGVAGAPIEPFLPMMMFAIVFGLSMDYEVFLLSRVKEEYDRTGDPKGSVADGLAATARVISAAAAIMVVVFGSFVFEDNRIVKMFGLGLAAAVLLDATLVRMLLVPATMELLGDRNWWIPKWLDRLLPHIEVEGHGDEILAAELAAEEAEHAGAGSAQAAAPNEPEATESVPV